MSDVQTVAVTTLLAGLGAAVIAAAVALILDSRRRRDEQRTRWHRQRLEAYGRFLRLLGPYRKAAEAFAYSWVLNNRKGLRTARPRGLPEAAEAAAAYLEAFVLATNGGGTSTNEALATLWHLEQELVNAPMREASFTEFEMVPELAARADQARADFLMAIRRELEV